MKNQREIYEVLLAGETLVHESGNKAVLTGLGNLEKSEAEYPNFYNPKEWQIYKEPKWCENIPDGGVLCLCKDGTMVKIKYYEGDLLYKKQGDTYTLDFVTPLTKQEIQIFLSNAPEDL